MKTVSSRIAAFEAALSDASHRLATGNAVAALAALERNTGAANVSAFTPMAIAPDIERLLDHKES